LGMTSAAANTLKVLSILVAVGIVTLVLKMPRSEHLTFLVLSFLTTRFS